MAVDSKKTFQTACNKKGNISHIVYKRGGDLKRNVIRHPKVISHCTKPSLSTQRTRTGGPLPVQAFWVQQETRGNVKVFRIEGVTLKRMLKWKLRMKEMLFHHPFQHIDL